MRFLEPSSQAIKGKGHRYSGLKCNVFIFACLNDLGIKGVFPVCGHQILLLIALGFLAGDRFDSGFEVLP